MTGAELGRVHLVGIGGAGMSGIARVLLARGVTVSGSDAKAIRIYRPKGEKGRFEDRSVLTSFAATDREGSLSRSDSS